MKRFPKFILNGELRVHSKSQSLSKINIIDMALDLDKLNNSPFLLDVLIQLEDILDSLDIYVFKNWIDGEVVEGPNVKKYFIGMKLRYDYTKMPDPSGAKRLLKYGVEVSYHEMTEGDQVNTRKDQKPEKCWVVDLNVPRRLIKNLNDDTLEFYDEEIDAEDVQDAADAGINKNTSTADLDSEEPFDEDMK